MWPSFDAKLSGDCSFILRQHERSSIYGVFTCQGRSLFYKINNDATIAIDTEHHNCKLCSNNDVVLALDCLDGDEAGEVVNAVVVVGPGVALLALGDMVPDPVGLPLPLPPPPPPTVPPTVVLPMTIQLDPST